MAATATFTTLSLVQGAHSLTVVYNGDTAAPFPLPTKFPFRGQWLPSMLAGYGLVVKPAQTAASLITSDAASHLPVITTAPTGRDAAWTVHLPGANVDEFFVVTARTVRPTAPLAGAMIKRRPDDWSA